jgi:hypothetical protein
VGPAVVAASGWPSRSWPGGFRCSGRLGSVRAQVSKSPTHPLR